jgi:ABC-type glycerol-3-phosphate transport system substrate-binding protein
MNRLISRLTGLLIILSIALSACSPITITISQADGTVTPDPHSAVESTPTSEPDQTPDFLQIDPQDLRGMTITFWYPWAGDMGGAMAEMVNRFNILNEYDIFVETRSFGSQVALSQAVDEALSSGEDIPQVVVAPPETLSWWGDAIVDLTPYLSSTEFELSEEDQADYFPAVWSGDLVGERRVGLPAVRSADMIFYNQAWADEMGYTEAPHTPEEFREQACSATLSNTMDNNYNNNGTGGWIENTSSQTILNWLLTFGYDNLPLSETDGFSFSTPDSENAITFLREMIDSGCAWTARNPEPYTYFASQQALFYSAPVEAIYNQAHTNDFLSTEFDWTVIPYPSENDLPVMVVYGTSYGILTGTPEQQLAAWLFLRFIQDPNIQVLLLEASHTLPLRQATLDLLLDSETPSSIWETAVEWMPEAQPAPAVSGWRIAQNLLSDAAWQSLTASVTLEGIPQVLMDLDASIADIVEQSR